MKRVVVRAAAGMAFGGMLPAAALAQAGWSPGVEIIGQPVQATTNGTTNTLYLDPGGQMRIMTPTGETVPGTWTAANSQLCLGAAGATECVPYSGRFRRAFRKR